MVASRHFRIKFEYSKIALPSGRRLRVSGPWTIAFQSDAAEAFPAPGARASDATKRARLSADVGVPGRPEPYISGKPFNRCTHTALSPDGDLYAE